ncbi:MAG TPA: methyl-accepting chemotaxis protein [Azospira sp.]|nr:methyl-accepting chemotaxis protein [Azospira sp.]
MDEEKTVVAVPRQEVAAPMPRFGRRLLLAQSLALVAGAGMALAVVGHGHGLVVGVAAIVLVGALLIGIGLVRDLRAWNLELHRFTSALEGGDLTGRIELDKVSSHRVQAERLNAMARSLVRVFSSFSRSAHELSSVARETTSNATGGNDGVRTQRDVTVSSAATIEQLSVSVAATSEHAATAADSAAATSEAAEVAAERVGALADTLSGLVAAVDDSAQRAVALGQRSREIGTIVALITEVAEQTNLLALNAAIEAARAGEQGRGFAVVADEVRKLAERTAKATREIDTRIGGIRDEVAVMVASMEQTNGRALASVSDADGAVQALDAARDNTRRTRQLISEIAAACAEQSSASQSVARSIEQVAQLADRNEALVRENSDLSRYLDQLAEQLAETLQRYRYE